MAKIISVHSFRGGTGKSNTTANLAAQFALAGHTVGVVDTDIQSPGIHVLFGLHERTLRYALNDFLWGKCGITDAAYEITAVLGETPPGRLYVIPSSINAGEITRVLREGYSVELLTDGFHRLLGELRLDLLLIDTHPGLNEETLLSMALSHILLILLRPDQQDYLGTGVTVEVARRLEVPRMLLAVNNTPEAFDALEVNARVQSAYGCEVVAVIPHSKDLMTLASGGIFSLHYPSHPLTAIYKRIAASLLA